MKKFSKKKLVLLSISIVIFCVAVILGYHAVDNSLTEEDIHYIQIYLSSVESLPEDTSYREELDYFISVQQSVLNIAPNNDEIPPGQKREPKDLYEAKTGWSFDKSRVIEKILRYSGFETRHISIYSTEKTGSVIKSLITSEISSHAVTEVLTKKGWLVVDSTAPWISTDTDNQPLSIDHIHACVKHALPIDWNTEPPIEIYLEPFVFIYGLYSRHGKFYPPYNLIPDIHYGEFIQNVL
ncbi:hypothetical protein JW824_05755 [bacterium]|nr:hypothetical protein [bacterium]RQV95970.1 MAG: hypothetical protein EH221_05320 [bacterium]